jgi:hypothetical protein
MKRELHSHNGPGRHFSGSTDKLAPPGRVLIPHQALRFRTLLTMLSTVTSSAY